MFGQELSSDSARIAESQESPSQLHVEVAGVYLNPNSLIPRFTLLVLRADNIPRIKKQFGLKRRFFVTVANGATVKKTESVEIDGQVVQWNQTLGAL